MEESRQLAGARPRSPERSIGRPDPPVALIAMADFLELARRRVVIYDGATGTYMQART